MKKSAIPNPLERRYLIERDAAPEASLRLAETYLAEGRGWEAIVFLQKAGAHDRLAALREEAVVAGDFFLVRELTRVLGDELPRRPVAHHFGSGGRRRQGTLRGFGASHGRTRGASIVTLKSFVVRGLAKELEEDLNKFLAARPGIEIVHMGQSESGDHISVVLIFDEPDPLV